MKTNDNRIKKLNEHKKSVEPEMKNPKSHKDHERLLEIMKQIDHNLQIEYAQHGGILEAMNSEDKF